MATYLVGKEEKLNNSELGVVFNVTIDSWTTETTRQNMSRYIII